MTRRIVAGFFLVLLFVAWQTRYHYLETLPSEFLLKDSWRNTVEMIRYDNHGSLELDRLAKTALVVGAGLVVIIAFPSLKRKDRPE